MTERIQRERTPCRLGYEEHDGTAYCHEHYGFALVVARERTCDRAALPPSADCIAGWLHR